MPGNALTQWSRTSILHAAHADFSRSDGLESEADRVATRVMQHDETHGMDGAGRDAARRTHGAHRLSPPSPPAGQPLEADDRRFFESRFQHKFGDVRIFADSRAGESARKLDARAYTVGNTITFANGEYQPGTHEGRQLLAHELAHVRQQQTRAGPRPRIQRQKAGTKPAAAKPKTLKDQGVDVTDPVHGKTADVIDAVLLRNQRLAPHIGARLKKGFRIAEKGKFVHELSDGNFENAYRSVHGESAGTTVPKNVLGFLDAKNSVIHLRPGARFGTALHEAMHRLAHSSFYTTYLTAANRVSNDLAEVLKEGVTAHFTDLVLHEEGLGRHVDRYAKLRKKAEKLMTALGTTGFDLIAELYFQPAGLLPIGKALGMSEKQYLALKGKGFEAVLQRMDRAL
jgi:hypothetical protein